MLKFAFIINMPGQTPETYSAVYENEESYSIIAGVDGVEAAKDYVKTLVDDGFTMIDFCGDFDDEILEDIRTVTSNGVKLRHAAYTAEEMDKLEKLQEMPTYGIVLVMRGVEEPHELVLQCDDCKTTAIFTKDMEQAKAAAKSLADRNISFIELCSWFDTDKMQAVIETVDGAVPVGSCGIVIE